MNLLFINWLILCLQVVIGKADLANDTPQVLEKLSKERQALSVRLSRSDPAEKQEVLKSMLMLGQWDEALAGIRSGNLAPTDSLNLMASWHWLHNDFFKSEACLDAVLQLDPDNRAAQIMQARLKVEAWQLTEAESLCRALLLQDPDNAEVVQILGRSLILQRNYPAALALAETAKKQHPDKGTGYLIEADVYFWNQKPDLAEPLLIKSLELDPFNADARFSYGYAIWRKFDATLLPQMEAQWQVALAVNPYHFQTQWHWGNGHTTSTFADYADPDEDAIRLQLAKADSLFSGGQIDQAIAYAELTGAQYPQSVIPLLYKGAYYYGDFDNPDRMARLDSAVAVFDEALMRKPGWGPARNALAAVIKSKRIPYLCTYDSIMHQLQTAEITDMEDFMSILPDVDYFPGNLAKAMIWNQMYTAIAYFPLIAKQQDVYVVPPLHKDLAIVMNRPYFRTGTTFDNRQWMDIRGVGSGATGIEYIERGAFQERNVVLHEFVHLFHGSILSDAENRRIRELYYHAMEHGLTLDYYSQNNEHEYLAQTYPAYFEPVKVHPLDFKSMNIESDLKTRDPQMYAFLDSMVSKERRALAGDQEAMATNWSQMYINLSRKHERNPAYAEALLDTARLMAPDYQPAYLAAARFNIKQGNLAAAEDFIRQSEALDPAYAPTFQLYAELEMAKGEAGNADRQLQWMEKAIALESDLQNRAGLVIAYRKMLTDHDKLDEAIALSAAYVADGPEVSTYLRDRKDDARMFVASQSAMRGETACLAIADSLVQKKPQNYEYRLAYSDELYANGEYEKSIDQMKVVQRIFVASKQRRADFDLRIAENYQALGTSDSVAVYLNYCLENVKALSKTDAERLARLQEL